MIIAAGLVVQLRMMVQRVLLRRMAMKHSLHMFISAIGYIATLFADFWGVRPLGQIWAMGLQHVRPHWGVMLIIFTFGCHFNLIITTIPFIGHVNHREISWE